MLKERLQILITSEQRRLLETEAKKRHVSIGSLIRDVIDQHYQTVTREERLLAFESLINLKAQFVAPDVLNSMIEDRYVERSTARWE